MYSKEMERQKKLGVHIKKLDQVIKGCEEAIRSFDDRKHPNFFCAPECPAYGEFLASNGVYFPARSYSKNSLLGNIYDQKIRLAILERMQRNAPISKKEHDSLLKMEVFQKDHLIKNYANIVSSIDLDAHMKMK